MRQKTSCSGFFWLFLALECGFLILQDFSVGGYGENLPRDKFAAVFQCCCCGFFQPAAAGDFHPHNGYASNAVAADNFGELFCVVGIVQFGAADEGHSVFDKAIVEIAVCVCGAIRCNKQFCIGKIGGIDGYQFNLHRPLGKTAGNGGVVMAVAFCFCFPLDCL